MLRNLKDLESYKVNAVDGDVGKVTDFLFDDQHWTARYLVTDTGGFWEGPNKVLISPISIRKVDWSAQLFQLGLTKDKVKHSPSVDLAKPVSRQYERVYSQYYGWPYYWGFANVWAWGLGECPYVLAESSVKGESSRPQETNEDPHLRSAKAVTGYHVHGKDGEIGHIADFIMDDETWTIRYLVIDTSNWWLGKKVLVAPHWAHTISWSQRMVSMDLTRAEIKKSPEWTPTALVRRDFEERLYAHYGRPAYWLRRESQEKASVQSTEAKHLAL